MDDKLIPVSANQDETSVAVDPLDPQTIVAGANDYSEGPPRAGVYVSRDGGATWTHGIIPGITSAGYQDHGDPALAFGPDGTAYYAGIAFGGPGGANALFLAVSHDGGSSWTTRFPFTSSSGSPFHDKPYIAVAPDGDVLLTYTHFGAGTIMFSKSSDQGATWTPRIALGGGQFSEPVAGPDGAIYVVWANGGIQFRRSLDGGASFEPAKTIGDANGITVPVPFRYFNYPTIAVAQAGPDAGTVYVAYGNWNAGTGTDLHLVRSRDRGTTWNAPEVVTQAPGGQFMPWLAITPQGDVGVLYADTSLTPLAANPPFLDQATLLLWTVSVNHPGDATWYPMVVSDAPSLANSAGGFWGDYQGMAASSAGLDPFWADGRNAHADGNTDPAHARIDPRGLL
jgi:hypothetical protein